MKLSKIRVKRATIPARRATDHHRQTVFLAIVQGFSLPTIKPVSPTVLTCSTPTPVNKCAEDVT